MTIRIGFFFCIASVFAILSLVSFHNAAWSADPQNSNTTLSQEQLLRIENESPAGVSHAAPHIAFAATQHDFGNVAAGARPRTEFLFKNTGDDTLVIKEVKGG